MYSFVLIVHSWLRWAALVAGLMAVVSAFSAPSVVGRDGRADRWSLAFMMTMDVQMLLGLLLYLALSPRTTAMFADMGKAMQDPAARFWAVEHVGTMLFAVVMIHVGRVLARKAATASGKRTRLLICLVAAFIAILIATPWPGMANGRPLFRV